MTKNKAKKGGKKNIINQKYLLEGFHKDIFTFMVKKYEYQTLSLKLIRAINTTY